MKNSAKQLISPHIGTNSCSILYMYISSSNTMYWNSWLLYDLVLSLEDQRSNSLRKPEHYLNWIIYSLAHYQNLLEISLKSVNNFLGNLEYRKSVRQTDKLLHNLLGRGWICFTYKTRLLFSPCLRRSWSRDKCMIYRLTVHRANMR